MRNDVIVLLLGATEGAYALAVTFSGDYGIPVCVMDREIPAAFSASAFVGQTRRVSGIEYSALFLRALSDFYEAHAGKSILLLPMTEEYTMRVLEEEETLVRMFILPQKKCPNFEDPDFIPDAMLLLYVGRTGEARTVYGEVAARTQDGEPLALITKTVPEGLASRLSCDTPHFALYAVGPKGECVAVGEGYAPLLAFPSASDLSLAEWLLADYVTCESIGEDGDLPSGLFTLFPYAKIKKRFLSTHWAQAKALRKKHLSVTLYPAYGETRVPLRRLRLHRFYRENWEKKIKPKK
ncbi:MAG: hypothetical protein E7609_05660 [Ruminococcaceae bacterium]|nr:hypothetical protein [Oscillospiraceae bacterium]